MPCSIQRRGDVVQPFHPPRVEPAPRPPRFPFYLPRLLGNNLALIPEAAYREPVVVAPGPPRMAFITGEEAVKEMLQSRVSEFPKGRLQNDVLGSLFGPAMVLAEGQEWRWQRAAAAPLFRHEELLGYGPIMAEAAEAVVERWRRSPAGAVQPIHRDMLRATFNVISRTMLAGGAPEVIDKVERTHSDYFRAINWRITYRMIGLPEWLPRPGAGLMRAHERCLRDETIRHIVESRRGEAAERQDLLSRLLRSEDPQTGRAMSDDLVVGNIAAFLVGGYDTTALTLAWTLYLVSRSPEWERRMVEEIVEVAGTGPVSSDHVSRLKVVQQVLNESMRLYPTAPIVLRNIDQDTEFDGITVPAGTLGVIPIYAIHRHREYWDDPDAFDPGRFDPEIPKPSRYRFMPFGAGPRICIGASFATIEATMMLATFVRAARFEAEPDFDPRPTGRMFLVPRSGMPLRVVPRELAS
jgi:cytochrome P450